MADKQISELIAASSVNAADLFVLEQSGTAKKLTGQILENWLVALANGHGGIQSIAKTGSAGTNPVVDTYTITFADTTTYTFTVTNGVKGDQGNQTYVWIKYASQQPTADNQMSGTPDAWMGIYVGLSSTAPAHYTDYDWYEIKGDKGDTGESVGNIVWTSNSGGLAQGAAGTTDTYTVYATDSTPIGTFTVYNGNDGQGSPGSYTPLTDSGAGAVGSANAYSREDHRHPLNVSASNPLGMGAASPGTSGNYARADHVHPLPTALDLLNLVYPVGSIYMSVNSTSPGTLFGGTWVQIKDAFLLSAGDTYTAGNTGGEAEHTLTVDELPSHTHEVTAVHYVSGANDRQFTSGGNWQQQTYNSGATGSGNAHNNMPPYLVVYVWQRTA